MFLELNNTRFSLFGGTFIKCAFHFNLQLFIDPAKLLPLNRFLPRPPQPKGPKKKGPPGGVGNQRGGFGARGGFGGRGRGGMKNVTLSIK